MVGRPRLRSRGGNFSRGGWVLTAPLEQAFKLSISSSELASSLSHALPYFLRNLAPALRLLLGATYGTTLRF